MSVIEAFNISAKYGKDYVFKDISFKFDRGDFIALSGPNGSGKSTLIKTLLGLINISSGLIKIFGKNINEYDEWHRVGYVPQKINLGLFFPASVTEVIKLGLIHKHYNKKEEQEKIFEVLNMLNINEIKSKNITELSGGQFQKVIIARAIVSEPDILILDEPTTALDPDTRERFFEILSTLNKKNKTTIILITHDTANTGKYANKLMYFDRAIVFLGTYEDFCKSDKMSRYFGYHSQHIICNRH